ncbi:MAG: LysM peptidoglycan-binding domain-containing protein [Cryomorphaceae bacterium]|nr:LysM peptidoglycan-binding domain-containing protein [Cryomorphaceae bacterium]
MRGITVAFVSHAAVSLWAQDSLSYQPIYMNASAIRSLQVQSGSKVPRLGLFGLSQPAAARFGWDRVQNDSAFAFDAAKTLWLDYYCLFGDSLSADWALVESPREVLKCKDLKPWNLVPMQNAPRAQPLPPLAFGGSLRLPAIAPEGPGGSPALSTDLTNVIKPSEVRIIVRSGDNFGILQRRHPGISLKELYGANRGSDRIYPGQVLIIRR